MFTKNSGLSFATVEILDSPHTATVTLEGPTLCFHASREASDIRMMVLSQAAFQMLLFEKS
jgi:hypothetical protein